MFSYSIDNYMYIDDSIIMAMADLPLLFPLSTSVLSHYRNPYSIS